MMPDHLPPSEPLHMYPLPPSASAPTIHPPEAMQSFPGPAGVPSFPPPPLSTAQSEQISGPGRTSLPLKTHDAQGLKTCQSTAEYALREVLALQRRRRNGEIGSEERLRLQTGAALSDLRILRRNVSAIVKAAENHRWRHWIVGGALASFIPVIRAIFRRPKGDVQTSNDTEYAFTKSKSLIRRIMDSVHGKGALANLTFVVFAVLYVFSNEVSLRIARTIHKKLKRLSVQVEAGQDEITEQDLEVLHGWRWRILVWKE